MAVGICGEDKLPGRPIPCNWHLASALPSQENLRALPHLQEAVQTLDRANCSQSANTPSTSPTNQPVLPLLVPQPLCSHLVPLAYVRVIDLLFAPEVAPWP